MAKAKGADFEEASKKFIKEIFEEMGYQVINTRKQWSGTQNGFDVRITFLDEDENARDIFFECKDYESDLDWSYVLEKVVELEGSNYSVDGFIVLSPKKELSNINDNLAEKLKEKFKFPIKYWTPNTEIEKIFALNPEVYKAIYKKDFSGTIDRGQLIKRVKAIVDLILNEKRILNISHIIEINETNKKPNEDSSFETNLDKKLNEIFHVK